MRKLSLMRLEQKVSHDLVDQKGKTVVMLCYVMLCYGSSQLASCCSNCLGSFECTVPYRGN